MDSISSITAVTLDKFINQIPGYFGIVDLQSKFVTLNKTGLQWIGFETSDEVNDVPYYKMRCRAAEASEFFIYQDGLAKLDSNQLRFLGYYCYANESWKVTIGEKYLLKNDCKET